MIKNTLKAVGYPRSGNTFLSYAIQNLYFPEEEINKTYHIISGILNRNKTLVPFRNPIDSIVSFLVFKGSDDYLTEINYYCDFNSGVLSNLNKVVLMDFDYFTKDLDYIKEKVKTNFFIDPVNNPTIDDIKNSMNEYHKKKNLPRNNKDLLDSKKDLLKQMPEFQECVDLYQKLKALT